MESHENSDSATSNPTGWQFIMFVSQAKGHQTSSTPNKIVWIAKQTYAENKGLFYLLRSHRKLN